MIEEPIVASGLDTVRIALIRDQHELDYFADSAWAERLPIMLRQVMAESFSGRLTLPVLIQETPGLDPDYILQSQVWAFEAEYSAESLPNIHIKLHWRIVDLENRRIIASRDGERMVAVSSNTLPAIMAAFDGAFREVMEEGEDFIMEALSPRSPEESAPEQAPLP